MPVNDTLKTHRFLGGVFKHVLFSPLLREMIQFDEYVSNGWCKTINVGPPLNWNGMNKINKYVAYF